MRELHLRFKDGDKEAELTMNDVDPHSQLAMIDGIFQFFDIGINLKEMSETYIKIGQAYKSFYDPIEPDYTDKIKEAHSETQNEPEIETKTIENEVKPVERKKETTHSKETNIKETFNKYPDYYRTGIKKENNELLYKVRYKCKCGQESNKYITPGTKNIKSHCCDKVMKVIPATSHGDPKPNVDPELYRDSYGNFYVAGLREKEAPTLNDKL